VERFDLAQGLRVADEVINGALDRKMGCRPMSHMAQERRFRDARVRPLYPQFLP
jgi:hypothetical protein